MSHQSCCDTGFTVATLLRFVQQRQRERLDLPHRVVRARQGEGLERHLLERHLPVGVWGPGVRRELLLELGGALRQMGGGVVLVGRDVVNIRRP